MRALAALLLVLCWSGMASAAPPCPDAEAWVQRCAQRSGLPMRVASCPANATLVVVTGSDGSPLTVEVSRRADAFRTVGGVGLSPLGNFPDWKNEPEARRHALDALTSCAKDGLTVERASQVLPPPTLGGGHTWPFALLFASAAALAALLAGQRRRLGRQVGLGVLAVVATVLVRRLFPVLPFFHQNGQAPLWVAFAVQGDAGAYGPGYPEIFHGVAALSARPDRAIGLLQEALAALVPLCLFAIARACSARPGVALLVGLWAALDPMLVRIARTEVYFATIVSLLCLAGAQIAWACSPHVPRRARHLALLAGALFIAQAARVHPLAWVPASVLPAIALLAERRQPLRRSLLVAGAIGVVVALVDGPMMLRALRSDLGGAFLPGAIAVARGRYRLALVVLALVAPLLAAKRTRPLGKPLLVLSFVLAMAGLADVLALDARPSDLAYHHAYLPAVIAAFAALSSLGPAPWSGALLVCLGVAHAVSDRRTLVIPTDAREQAFCLEWRESLPPEAQVTWVARADKRVLELPLVGKGLPRAAPIRDSDPRPPTAGVLRFYYRGSLCTTPEGAPLCRAFEDAHRLRAVQSRTFPGVNVVPWLPLGPDPITVTLFAIE